MLHETIEQLLPPYRNTYISCEKKNTRHSLITQAYSIKLVDFFEIIPCLLIQIY